MQKQKSFKESGQSGSLYLVPTPIGHLMDMTYRAVATLEEVSLIASEDTRTTQKLLNHFEIKTPQTSLHEHNYKEKIPKLLAELQNGLSVAQVSDAGMPSISDPGHELVVASLAAGIKVIALPGPTAGVTALIASGLSADTFSFNGFLPRKKTAQVSCLLAIKERPDTQIFYESPYRMLATIETMIEHLGGARQAVICRELTKIHEEYLRGSLTELLAYLKETPLKGECCLLVAGQKVEDRMTEDTEWQNLSIHQHVTDVMQTDSCSSKEAIKKVANLRNIKKQEVYKIYHNQ